MNAPIDSSGNSLESQLGQLPLAEPSHALDQRIEALLDTKSALPARTNVISWRWSRLVGGTTLALATVASLLLFLNLPLANSNELVAFKKMHGHSGSREYSQCASCHAFATPQEQVLDKWLDDSIHANFSGNCNLCHVSDLLKKHKGNSAPNSPHLPILPPADLPSGELPFDQWHGHSKNPQFNACADCHHQVPEKRGIEKRNVHWDQETNCSMCHTTQDDGATP